MRQRMNKKGNIEVLENFKNENAPWIIFFHGFGADANDLFSLQDHFQIKSDFNWLCPNGLLEVPIGPGWTGRAWWNIQMANLETDFSNEVPVGIENVRIQVSKMIKQLGIPWNKIILGGFSQGAMLAIDTYLHAEETPLGLAILSGSLICKSQWKPLVAARAGQEFFISHGQQDPVLKIGGAQRLHQFLTENGMKGKFNSFLGGHEIPGLVVSKLSEYLAQRVELDL